MHRVQCVLLRPPVDRVRAVHRVQPGRPALAGRLVAAHRRARRRRRRDPGDGDPSVPRDGTRRRFQPRPAAERCVSLATPRGNRPPLGGTTGSRCVTRFRPASRPGCRIFPNSQLLFFTYLFYNTVCMSIHLKIVQSNRRVM